MKKKTIFKFKSLTCKLLSAIFLSMCIIFSICVYYSFAEVPCKINYQGRLIENNVPVDGTRKMRFTIYDSAAGGNELWTSGDVDITVYNGLFRYVLDLSSIDDWTAGEELYLQVVVDGETLTPLEAIYAYPYAINSHLLEGKTTGYFLNRSAEEQTKRGNLGIEGRLDINAPDTDIDALRVHSGDTYGLYVSTGGNVGMGTTSPGAKLELRAPGSSALGSAAVKFSVTEASNLPVLVLQNSYAGGNPGTDQGLLIDVQGSGGSGSSNLHVKSGDASLFYVRNDGNVGIGTTEPGIKFDTREAYDHSYVVPTGGADSWVDLGELPTDICGIFTYIQHFFGVDPWRAQAIGFISTVGDNWTGTNPELPMSIAYHNNDTKQVIKFRVRATSGPTPPRLEIYRSTNATEEGTFRIYRFGY